MARKKITYKAPKKDESWKKEKCDDCLYGKWNNVYWNLGGLDRKPITLRCPFYKNGEVGIIRGTQACSRFMQKTEESYLYP